MPAPVLQDSKYALHWTVRELYRPGKQGCRWCCSTSAAGGRADGGAPASNWLRLLSLSFSRRRAPRGALHRLPATGGRADSSPRQAEDAAQRWIHPQRPCHTPGLLG
jgi:hypothetical protein